MDAALTPSTSPRPIQQGDRAATPGVSRWALGIFALLVVLTPLAFGGVDRAVQAGVAVLFAIGLLVHPPSRLALSPLVRRLALAFAVLVILKEVLPATWFGTTDWRKSLVDHYGLALTATHHPEIGRAIDAWLEIGLGVAWFLWVRTLAAHRASRVVLAWILLISAFVVAMVSFATASPSSHSIYGLRYTAGWSGFGPFPNRNHTGDFLAMGVIVGIGCAAYAASRKKFALATFAALPLPVIALALLRTHSRGALLVLGAGLAILLGLFVVRTRKWKTAAIAVTIFVLVGGIAGMAGQKTLTRLMATGQADDYSASTRVTVWSNTLTMWKDSPLFGHGAGAFASIFPFYQDVATENVTVKHPESSVLLCLVEFGAVPMALALGSISAIVWPYLRSLIRRRSGYYLAAAGFAAAFVLLLHSCIDVPGHRWGTIGFALAALAIACPAVPENRTSSQLFGWLAAGIALFWSLPFWAGGPVWSPTSLDRLLGQVVMRPTSATVGEIRRLSTAFPLSAQLHLTAGETFLATGQPPATWQNEFRIAARLLPASWRICAQIAQKLHTPSPALALHYWQVAVERASIHREEVFQRAIRETAELPPAHSVWNGYVATHPELALFLCEARSGEEARALYQSWWQERGAREQNISKHEADAFLRVVGKWGALSELSTWMVRHADRQPFEFGRWAKLLSGWNQSRPAWEIIAREIPEPKYPARPPHISPEQIQARWANHPEDLVNARYYAEQLELGGDSANAERVIAIVAASPQAPRWFVEKAAYQLAARERFDEAVELVLRSGDPRPN